MSVYALMTLITLVALVGAGVVVSLFLVGEFYQFQESLRLARLSDESRFRIVIGDGFGEDDPTEEVPTPLHPDGLTPGYRFLGKSLSDEIRQRQLEKQFFGE